MLMNNFVSLLQKMEISYYLNTYVACQISS